MSYLPANDDELVASSTIVPGKPTGPKSNTNSSSDEDQETQMTDEDTKGDEPEVIPTQE